MKQYDDILSEEQKIIMKYPIGFSNHALPIQERNRLFDFGYLKDEFGIYELPQGGKLISNHTSFYKTSGKMLQWWFAWCALDQKRFQMWNPENHIGYYLPDQSINRIQIGRAHV